MELFDLKYERKFKFFFLIYSTFLLLHNIIIFFILFKLIK